MKCIKLYAKSKCIVSYKRKIRYLENDTFPEILSKKKDVSFIDKEYYQFVCYIYERYPVYI